MKVKEKERLLWVLIRSALVSNEYPYFKIVSVSLLNGPLIQEGQLSVSGKRMCTSTGLKPYRGLNYKI